MTNPNKPVDLVLLKITSRDDLGRVRGLEIVYDHETVDVSNPANREFLTAFMERGVLKAVNARGLKSTPTASGN
jgi:hypothetical protein